MILRERLRSYEGKWVRVKLKPSLGSYVSPTFMKVVEVGEDHLFGTLETAMTPRAVIKKERNIRKKSLPNVAQCELVIPIETIMQVLCWEEDQNELPVVERVAGDVTPIR